MSIEAKIKINEFNRHLFPELAKSLEKYGQLQPILIDDNGYLHDGGKRALLCGLEQLAKIKVPIDTPCSNLGNCTKEQKKILIRSQWKEATKTYGRKVAEELSKRYGVNRATIYRWINSETVANATIRKEEPKSQTVEPKDMMAKCPCCHAIFPHDDLEIGTYENLKMLPNNEKENQEMIEAYEEKRDNIKTPNLRVNTHSKDNNSTVKDKDITVNINGVLT